MSTQAIHSKEAVQFNVAGKKDPTYFTVSAWAVPVLMVGQFALVSALPIALIAYGAFSDRRIRALRWWATAMAALYAMPLVFWLIRDDGAQSLSKDIHPAFVLLVTASALVILAKIHRSHRK